MTAAIKRPAGNPFGFLPIPRRGTAEEIASSVVHVASRESGYITGAEVVVDGGLGAGPIMPSLMTW
jgi:NAD(P)-dependent dehydrogenase (short-subunit alcohol dehydrogenase family)